ncbi:NAD(P)/FAD-dependent oxidoreductase [Neobacillus terrae]|uniref:NAD(P)/FAD-dependent oxidoreductase n=1 Tax=Neobacillus terrae TaxID=3034837 RepID=UPI00140BB196|nr:FAD-dependent oxidoreductase [Neobacillus terrae]NHM30770.1 FAD-dependent oxidoreductase [Neobacillus terrae]
MENVIKIVVVGGGYAGINLIESLKKEFHKELKRNIRIILVDKNTFHFKKVKLFKGIVNENVSDLHVPLKHYCRSVIEFIQGELTAINSEEQNVLITREDESVIHLDFDRLVLALGSVVREADPERGGISLKGLESAQCIRQQLLEKMLSAKSNLRVVIAGSGITGIETAAEVGSWLKEETEKAGRKPNSVEVFLINDKQRLLYGAPEKIGKRLQSRLMRHGIKVMHNKKVERFLDGKVIFSDNTELKADVCVWTVGLKPHPSIFDLGLSLTEEGKIKVDSWYRLVKSENIYAIGDCIHVVDPISGTVAAMSCKEAISQAQRLAQIMKSHIRGDQASVHQTYPDLICIGLGPKDGFVWAQKWGVDFVLSGKLAEKIREYTWNIASIAR